VLNANDGSVWAAFENRVLHFDATGVLRGTIAISANDLAVAQDGSLWILTQSALQQRDASGAVLRNIALANNQRMKFLALDDAGSALWIAGEKDLLQLSLTNPAQTLLSIVAPETIAGISVDLQTGDLWAIGQNGLFAYSRAGQPRVSRDLRDFSIANPQTLLFDFSSQAAWVGHQGGLTRITSAGTVAATFPGAPHVVTIAIGRTPVSIVPVVSIAAPADGATLSTGTPQLKVEYDALCGAATCGFPKSFFSSFTLSALVNGIETGSSFVFDPATGTASYTPAARLPEGINTFSAQAHDSFGRLSETVTSSFTIDTIAPAVTAITPTSGAVVSTPDVTIAGSVDDPAATITLGGMTQGSPFSFPVSLVEGLNSFTLEITDAAGNTTSVVLTYTYEKPNVLPSASIVSPAAGTIFTAPASFAIAANASDADGTIVRVDFFVNGVLLAADTTAPFEAQASALGIGTYTLTAQATDNRGGSVTSAPIAVTVGAPNVPPVVTLIPPTINGKIFAPATLAVGATASDSDGTIVKVEFLRNGLVASTDTTAPYEATLTDVPAGIHILSARATDDRGGVTTSSSTIVTVTAVSVIIDTPLSGAGINANNVLVRGRFVAPANSGVTVNGSAAAVDTAGNFAVLMPLAAGTNILTANLTTFDGRTASATVFVNASGAILPFAVDASPMSGLAPLTTAFTISNPNNANVTFTFDGFGPFFLGAGATVQLNVTYQAGVHTPNIIFRFGTSAWQYRAVIESLDPAATDATLHSLWNGLNGALAAGDKPLAMRYLNNGAQERYGAVFDALMPYMPGIVASYSPLEQVSLTDTIGEYAVTRLDGGTRRLYLIHFMRDASGVWRIDGM
ncbi:MAG TPA: Ig-like domain-containing protein, partial [Thermoanaerobaculia bacterium]